MGMIKAVDLKETLFSFREQIQNKAKFYEVEKGSSLTLEVIDSNQRASFGTLSTNFVVSTTCMTFLQA